MTQYLVIKGGSQNGGDKVYALNDKIEFYKTDMEKKWRANPKRFHMYVGDGQYTEDQLLKLDTQKFLMVILKDSSLSSLCNHMLRDLHESMAKLFVVMVHRWFRKHPEQVAQLDFKELPLDSESFTPNYTNAMKRLKLMRFKGYDGDGIKGFCPFEPLARLKQLLTFPIELFADNLPDLSKIIKKVTPPEEVSWDYKRVPNDPSLELYNRIMATIPVLRNWEKYYTELCSKLKDTIDEINAIVPIPEFKDL